MKGQILFAILATLLVGSLAQGDSAQHAPLSNIPPPADGIETKFWFPEHTSLQLPAGDTVETLVALHSSASESYNVTAIFGSLNNPAQFSMYFYNFTPQAYQRTLRPGEELSISYPLYVPFNLPAREFQVALTVFYTKDNAYYANTFFNRTIDVVEKSKWVDFEILFLWVLLFAAIGGLGYVAYHYISSLGFVRKQKSKRAPKRPAREMSPAKSDADEWLKGTHFAQGTKAPRKRASDKDLRKNQLRTSDTE